MEDPKELKKFLELIRSLSAKGAILAYHDRSDGGLAAALCEMMFASHVGVEIVADALVSKDRTLNQALSTKNSVPSFRWPAGVPPKWKEASRLPVWAGR